MREKYTDMKDDMHMGLCIGYYFENIAVFLWDPKAVRQIKNNIRYKIYKLLLKFSEILFII